MTYSDAAQRLHPRTKRKLANNTYLERRRSDCIAVRLHSTDIVTFWSDGTVVLNSGGWHTITTKDRLNTFMPRFNLWSIKGIWTLYDHTTEYKWLYYDSFTYNTQTGEVINGERAPEPKQRNANVQSMFRLENESI